ncbi:MAG: hypothetical protein LIO53_02265 [Oscillospiraceae bacterium]|nr:hypothetical protein [Oscillospiraceae bacterium]
MIKKILALITAIAVAVVCGTSVFAYDSNTNVSICASRTAYDRTYIIQVSFDLRNENNKDFKQIAKELKSCDSFTETFTPFECEVYIDGECYSLGTGRANKYFADSGNVYWEFIHEFEDYGYYDVEADIYKNSQLISGCIIEVAVYPPHDYSISDATDNINTSYAYKLTSLINEERQLNGLNSLSIDCCLVDIAETKLIRSLESNRISHNDLDSYYKSKNIKFKLRDEVFICGASNPSEVLQTLMQSPTGSDLLYEGEYKYIGIAAICDLQNIMYWLVEFYK